MDADEDGGKKLRVVGAGRARTGSPVVRYLVQEVPAAGYQHGAKLPSAGDVPLWLADEQDGELTVMTRDGDPVEDPDLLSRVRAAVDWYHLPDEERY